MNPSHRSLALFSVIAFLGCEETAETNAAAESAPKARLLSGISPGLNNAFGLNEAVLNAPPPQVVAEGWDGIGKLFGQPHEQAPDDAAIPLEHGSLVPSEPQEAEEDKDDAPVSYAALTRFIAERKAADKQMQLVELSDSVEGLSESERVELLGFDPPEAESDEAEKPALADESEATSSESAEAEPPPVDEELERQQVREQEEARRAGQLWAEVCQRRIFDDPRELDADLHALMGSDRSIERKAARLALAQREKERAEALDELRQQYGAANLELIRRRMSELRTLSCNGSVEEREGYSVTLGKIVRR